MVDLIIAGAGGFGKEVAWIVERINHLNPTWRILGFTDKDTSLNTFGGYPVLGPDDVIADYGEVCVACAIGSPTGRQKVSEAIRAINPRVQFPVLVDPSAVAAESASLSEGVIVAANAVISADVSIGRLSFVNFGAIIGHDAVLEDYVSVFPQSSILGAVRLCSLAQVGAGSQLLQGITIGKNTTVAMGSVVMKDAPENCLLMGNPARPIMMK